MISARPVTADSGSPPAMPLAVQIRSGSMPSCSQANIAPVRANPVCTSSAMNTTLFLRHQSSSAGRKPSAGTMKPPSPWMGSMITAARLSAPTCLSITSIARLAASSPESVASSLPYRVAERIRQRRTVDLGGKRAEAVLIRLHLRGQRHRQVGAAVVGVIERHHRLLVCVGPGDLDRVLHRLGAPN